MPNEIELVTHLTAGERGIPSSLLSLSLEEEKTLNMQNLFSLAHEHKLTGTLFSALKKQNPEIHKRIDKFKTQALLEKTSRTFMVDEALHICETLHISHLPALIIKGPILSLQLYGSPVVREYTDIDIVVDTQDFFTVDTAMHTLGYSADPESQVKQFNNIEKTRSNIQRAYIQKPHHIIYKNPTHPYRIEIHNEFFTGSNLPEEYNLKNIFSRAKPIEYNESTYNAIQKTDHYLFMMKHGTKHGWSQLHWVLDAAALLTVEDSTLHNEILQGCINLHLEKHLVLMILVVTALLPVPIPSAYLDLTAQYKNRLKKQQTIALKTLRSPAMLHPSILHTLQFAWNYSAPLALTLKEKINIILNPFKASPTDIDKLNLPGWIAPLHLLIRPFFVLSRRIKKTKGAT